MLSASSEPAQNCLGEHIDYAGYSVLPCAIELDVLMACSVEPAPAGSSSSVDLRNVDPDRYADERFTFEGDASGLPVDARELLWHNYFRAGLKGVLAHIARGTASLPALNIRVTCDGIVPAGGGLSSSSAMTACAAIATMHAFEATDRVSRREVTNIAIESERSVDPADRLEPTDREAGSSV